MIGLEYMLHLYGMQQQQLAERLGIKKQNVNLWIKKRQNISKKHLPSLIEIFGQEPDLYQKELTDLDKLLIQKEKLMSELKPKVIGYNSKKQYKPIYDSKEFYIIQNEIEKAKLVEEYKEIVSLAKDSKDIKYLRDINDRLKQTIKSIGTDERIEG